MFTRRTNKILAFLLLMLVFSPSLGCTGRKYLAPAEYKDTNLQILSECLAFLFMNKKTTSDSGKELQKYYLAQLGSYDIDKIEDKLMLIILYSDSKDNNIDIANARDNLEYNVKLQNDRIQNTSRELVRASDSKKVYISLLQNFYDKKFRMCKPIYEKAQSLDKKSNK